MITLFGATGYTGSLVARELARLGAEVTLAGRDQRKLDSLKQALGGGVKTAVAAVGDKASLAAICQNTRVVVNCAGPFLRLGRPVVEAAIEAGAHYLDTTGEQLFMKDILDLDSAARGRGAALVSAVAVEFVPTDCLAAVLARDVGEVICVETLALFGFEPSVGTMKSALAMLREDGFAYAAGDWVRERLGSSVCTFELPGLGRMSGLSYPGGDIVTLSRHFPAARIKAYLAFPSTPGWLTCLASFIVPVIPLLMRSPLGAWAERRLGARGTGGPSEARRKSDQLCFAVRLTGRSDGRTVKTVGVLTGKDAYGMTAVIAAHGALLMSDPSYQRAGFLAPAEAYDPEAFLKYLEGFGLERRVTR